MKPYKDKSIFYGWKQYFDEKGIEWRREDSGIYKFYKEIGNAFIHQGNLNSRSKGIKKLHQEFIDQESI